MYYSHGQDYYCSTQPIMGSAVGKECVTRLHGNYMNQQSCMQTILQGHSRHDSRTHDPIVHHPLLLTPASPICQGGKRALAAAPEAGAPALTFTPISLSLFMRAEISALICASYCLARPALCMDSRNSVRSWTCAPVYVQDTPGSIMRPLMYTAFKPCCGSTDPSRRLTTATMLEDAIPSAFDSYPAIHMVYLPLTIRPPSFTRAPLFHSPPPPADPPVPP
jgi:hypothetical protein